MLEYLIQLFKVSLKIAAAASLTFIFLSLLSNYLTPLKISLNTKNVDQKNLFTVEGDGTVYVKPDLASLNLGFTVQSPSVTGGQGRANDIINKVQASLKSLGVSQADIKTTAYNIYPNYDYSGGQSRLNGYTINISLGVKVRNFDLLNKVIDSATSDGVNQVSGVTFEVEKKDEAENEALKLAIEAAKKKAAEISSLSGIRLGSLVNVRQNVSTLPPPLYAMGAQRGSTEAAPATQVEPGQNEIKVTVSLDYETL
ncbi:MAG: SIMPL domain-containing protein [Patescibacteria group bacterium]|nr:SIMPL domain-containing protein [Patescibacteria group bacterium]